MARGTTAGRGHSPPGEREDSSRVKQLVAEFEAAGPAEKKSFYEGFANNHNAQNSVFQLLAKEHSSHEKLDDCEVEIVKRLCGMLLALSRHVTAAKTNYDMTRGRIVVVQFLPQLVGLHLTSRTFRHDRNAFKFVDALLLAVYNAEAAGGPVPVQQQQNRPSLRVPALSTSSIYHDNTKLETEEKLEQRPGGVSFGADTFGPVDVLTASTRTRVLQLLLQMFSRYLCDMPKFGVDNFTRSTARLLERGYTARNVQPRIQLDGPVLLELLNAAYVCMYNGFQVPGNQIIDLIHARASMSGNAQVLLATNAVKNLIVTSGPSQIVTTHVSTPVQLAKNMITNASFRAKKMQQDIIPKVQPDEAAGPPNNNNGARPGQPAVSMVSIVEEATWSAHVSGHAGEGEEKTPTKSDTAGKVFNKEKLMAKLRKKAALAEEQQPGPATALLADPARPAKAKAEKKKKANKEADASTNGEAPPVGEPDTLEKVEELIQMKKLPAETITIHSPESGTTIF